MSVVYTKVDETSVEVVTLAKQLGVEPKKVAAMLNQDRYRKAYNRQHNLEIAQLRKLVRDNPELLKEVK